MFFIVWIQVLFLAVWVLILDILDLISVRLTFWFHLIVLHSWRWSFYLFIRVQLCYFRKDEQGLVALSLILLWVFFDHLSLEIGFLFIFVVRWWTMCYYWVVWLLYQVFLMFFPVFRVHQFCLVLFRLLYWLWDIFIL
jgi:hypothetical protein